jgi:hypothetical protein
MTPHLVVPDGTQSLPDVRSHAERGNEEDEEGADNKLLLIRLAQSV